MRKALILVLITFPGYAFACSCLRTALEDQVKDSEKIFVGVLTSSKIVNPRTDKEWPYIEGTIEVETIIKGKVGKIEKVRTGLGGGDCGISMTTGRAYVIFSISEENYIGICGASGELRRYEEKEYVEKLKNLAGKGSNK